MKDGAQKGISRNEAHSLHMMSGFEEQESITFSGSYDPTAGSFTGSGNLRSDYTLRAIHNSNATDAVVTVTLATGQTGVVHLIKSGVTEQFWMDITAITSVTGGTTLTLLYMDNLVVKNAGPSRSY